MKVFLVEKWDDYEGLSEILKIFSDRRNAEEYISEYNILSHLV